jgi:hypothetical protein
VLTASWSSLRRTPVAVLLVAALSAAVGIVVAVGAGLFRDPSTGTVVAAVVVAAAAGIGWARLCLTRPVEVVATTVLLSAIGVWLAVPDTEAPVAGAAALAAMVALALVSRRDTGPWPGWGSGLAILGWVAVAAVIALAAAWGASGRTSTLPGALGCFGVALVVPWIALVVRREGMTGWTLVVAQAAAIVLASRWAARATGSFEGLLRTAAVLLLLAVAYGISARSAGRAHPLPYDRGERPR